MTETTINETDLWLLPDTEELANQKSFSNAPLVADDYVCKIVRAELKKVPAWNAKTGKSDYSKMTIAWEVILMPYQCKSGDPLLTTDKETVEPLDKILFRQVNPFSLGMKKDGTPAMLRALIAYATGHSPDPSEQVQMPGVIIIDSTDNVVSDEKAKAYKENFMKLKRGEILPNEFELAKADLKHIADIRPLVGKYVGVKITLKDEKENVAEFSKLPLSFKADADIDVAGAKNFNETIWPRIQKKREEKAQGVKETAVDQTRNVPVSELSIEDIPF